MHQAQKPAEKVLKIGTVWNAIDTNHLLQSSVELENNQAQYIYDLINLAPNELAFEQKYKDTALWKLHFIDAAYENCSR